MTSWRVYVAGEAFAHPTLRLAAAFACALERRGIPFRAAVVRGTVSAALAGEWWRTGARQGVALASQDDNERGGGA